MWTTASTMSAAGGWVTEGQLFRAQAAAALLVAGSAFAAVLLYRYVNVGQLGPLPRMYEPSWDAPGKLPSAYAEGTGAVLAALGLLLACQVPGLMETIKPLEEHRWWHRGSTRRNCGSGRSG